MVLSHPQLFFFGGGEKHGGLLGGYGAQTVARVPGLNVGWFHWKKSTKLKVFFRSKRWFALFGSSCDSKHVGDIERALRQWVGGILVGYNDCLDMCR